MPNLFSPEAQKITYSTAFLGSIAFDVWLALNSELSFEDKVEQRALVTLASIIVFTFLNWLDRQTTIHAMSKSPRIIETHSEFRDINFAGDKDKIKAFFKQSNLKILTLYDASGQESIVIREKTFLGLLVFFPFLILALTPHKIKNSVVNVKNSSKF